MCPRNKEAELKDKLELLVRKTSAPIKVLAFMEAGVVNGAAKTLLNLCDTLRETHDDNPVDITIATFHRGIVPEGKPANAFVEAVESRGLRAIVIPERYRFDPRSLRMLRNVVRRENPDLIQTNNIKSHAMIKMAGLHRERRWLAFHHGYTAPDFKMKLYNQLDRWSLPTADRVVTVCGPFRNQLISKGVPSSRIRVLHNSASVIRGVPRALSDRLRQQFGIPDDGTKVLLSVGRLSFEKGHADLLHALKVLQTTRNDLRWKLLLVGSGPEESNLRELAERLGLQSQIIFTSHQPNVLPFYGVADVMVLPSHTEGSPHVVLEAMSTGVPIMATAVGGVPEILTQEQTALLVPPRNAEAMSAALSRLLESPGLAQRLAKNAKHVLIQNFSHEAYRQSLLGIYDELLQPATPVSIRRPA
jgi:glycosyltransferase involved in cell wall biosynthesis